ncbi:MAG: cyclic nucleotide-binding domain-containing protein [Deltaproteobacteria bacterium]|nr:cyclic nucleotide-binding domain-containing protein [Deltaproteobacteria bacterium]
MAPSRASDLDILRKNRALALLGEDDLARLSELLDQLVLPTGSVVVREGDRSADMYFVLEGGASVERHGLELAPLSPGDHFGELGMLGQPRRAATITARGPLRLARLGRRSYEALCREHSHSALHLVEALAHVLAQNWVTMTDRVGILLGERMLPRRSEVTVQLSSGTDSEGLRRVVSTGTHVGDLLPAEVDGRPLVAALLDGRPVALDTPIASDAWLAPIGLGSPDGRDVFQRSAGLLVLAAAQRLRPEVVVHLGPALAGFQHVDLDLGPVEGAASDGAPDPARAADSAPALARHDFVSSMSRLLEQLCSERTPFSEEIWTIEEARDALEDAGWDDAAALLDSWRDGTVPMVRCGSVRALRTGPLLPHAGLLTGISLSNEAAGVVLRFGPALEADAAAASELAIEAQSPRYNGAMVREGARWQRSLGITSVGALNRTCVAGRVNEIIRVAEGFHEKRIGQLADGIRGQANVRVITIAGPSSSGKTTFIKRLMTQLQVNGLTPRALSLDDYYVDRERTPVDASGALDYEALSALDLAVLQRDVAALLTGAEITPPHYDFKHGRSQPGGGAPLMLGPADVLLLEGIHGLNPGLLGQAAPPGRVFRIFIHPVSNLPLDQLSRVAPEDLRLLRRIVRDRHGRAISAADNIARWPSVRRGELLHIYPFLPHADVIFDSSLVYELAVLKVYAERYLLEVPPRHPSSTVARRLRQLCDRFVAIYPEHVPPTSILREFIGGSGFEY